MKQFDIPVVLFLFKRTESTLKIIERIKCVLPKKIYLLSDDGRNEEECAMVKKCRKDVEDHIDWDCEIIKNYASGNRGVYANIGLGAKWVLEREPWAIFLEDDNLPEVSFFSYCRELLLKYKDNERVLWICGTNYLGSYKNSQNHSYMFTQHLLPCGWASWSHKFLKYYDGELDCVGEIDVWSKVRKTYLNEALFNQQKREILSEYARKQNGERFLSWDYQMNFSIRYHNLLGISPANNQIKNIGVDEFSIHGGNSWQSVMTRRFCGMPSYELNQPMIHPETVSVDGTYEKKIGKVILRPLSNRIFQFICHTLKSIISENNYEKLRSVYHRMRK